jgi:DNA-binding NarL/FixJ family response regulator
MFIARGGAAARDTRQPVHVLVVASDSGIQADLEAALSVPQTAPAWLPSVTMAPDLDDARGLVRMQRDDLPAVVLVDRDCPAGDADAIDRLKKGLPRGTRVVVLLGPWQPIDKMAAAADGVMRKPVNPASLWQLVDSAARQRFSQQG